MHMNRKSYLKWKKEVKSTLVCMYVFEERDKEDCSGYWEVCLHDGIWVIMEWRQGHHPVASEQTNQGLVLYPAHTLLLPHNVKLTHARISNRLLSLIKTLLGLPVTILL